MFGKIRIMRTNANGPYVPFKTNKYCILPISSPPPKPPLIFSSLATKLIVPSY